MITKIKTLEELKQIFVEVLLNNTDNVTKISDTSVLNAISYGVAKIAQKNLKDISIIEAHIFPDTAYGNYLDELAKLKGISQRKQSSKSSMYVRIFAQPGTQYVSGTHTFTGSHGIIFELENTITVSNSGYTYAKVKSTSLGSITNVQALSTNKVTPIPSGHFYCINEYQSIGGRDFENDDIFRENTIKTEINILAKNTISQLEQIFSKINERVLRCFNYGNKSNGKIKISVLSVDGTDFSNNEFIEIYNKCEKFLSLTELKSYGGSEIGIELSNIVWQPIDISFRCDLDYSYNIDAVRNEIQVQLNKEFDYRYWNWDKKIEWDNLLEIVKKVKGVKYVPDNYFYPNKDVTVDKNKLPRIRGFQLLDLNGNLVSNYQNTLQQIYYPSNIDFQYQSRILSSI